MNPTEKLYEDLLSLLTAYETTTGICINCINLERIKDNHTAGQIRADSPIYNISIKAS